MTTATSSSGDLRSSVRGYDLFFKSRRHALLGVCDLITGNRHVDIQSGEGEPTGIPARWSPVLGDTDALVLIPDMHMFVHHSNLDNFKFGAEAMRHFLQHLVSLQVEMASEGLKLRVFQLGDMYELCYPDSRGKRVSVDDIVRSHPLYGEIVRLFDALGTGFVAGNHDIHFHRRQHNAPSVTLGQVYLEHGFSADRWYHFTDPTRLGWDTSAAALLTVRRLESRIHSVRRRWGKLDDDAHSAIGIVSGEREQSEYPAMTSYPERTLRHYAKQIRKMPWFSRPRICAVAHTHTPTLVSDFADGECIFVDAGAWTEGRSDFVLITNSEIAVCRYRRTPRPAHAASLSA